MVVVASIRLLIHVHASLYPRRVIRFGVDRRARPRASQPASQPATRKRVRIGTRLISTKIIKWRPSPPGSAVLNFAPILLSPPTQPAFSLRSLLVSSATVFLFFFSLLLFARSLAYSTYFLLRLSQTAQLPRRCQRKSPNRGQRILLRDDSNE